MIPAAFFRVGPDASTLHTGRWAMQQSVGFAVAPASMPAMVATAATSGVAPAPRSGITSLGSYAIAAGIAVGLVAAWLGLCII